MSHTVNVHGNHHPHFAQLVNQLVSGLAPFSALQITVTVVVIAFIRLYILDTLLLQKIYPTRISKTITDTQRRSFINHHVAAGTKIVLVVTGACPLLSIIAGSAGPHKPISEGSEVTMGDMLVVCSNIFTAMYIFELFYRDKVSPISFLHHVGTIVIAQAAVAMTINFDHQRDAIPEFILCLVWGAFDVLAELWPHISMILYRTHNSDPHFLHKIFKATAMLELFGTTMETAVVMWLFGSAWDRWTLSLKVVTPILHVLFSCAQLWGVWIFWQLAKQQKAKSHEKSDEAV